MDSDTLIGLALAGALTWKLWGTAQAKLAAQPGSSAASGSTGLQPGGAPATGGTSATYIPAGSSAGAGAVSYGGGNGDGGTGPELKFDTL